MGRVLFPSGLSRRIRKPKQRSIEQFYSVAKEWRSVSKYTDELLAHVGRGLTVESEDTGRRLMMGRHTPLWKRAGLPEGVGCHPFLSFFGP